MTPLLPDPDAAMRSLGCTTCLSRIRAPGALDTCLYWPSAFFGSSRLPVTGCQHWTARGFGDRGAQGVDVACEASEDGAIMQKGPAEARPFRIEDVTSAPDLPTSGDRDRDG